jgi:aspartyl-tRNA(Asn)/glutamyl-tRNA(Gln) amidotransferase subunit C
MGVAGNSADNDAGPGNDLAPDVVRHIARLSRLELDDQTLARYGRQLGDVLQHARALAALDLADVQPLVYPGESADVWGEDEPTAPMANEVAMRLAPQCDPPFVTTPKALGDASQA